MALLGYTFDRAIVPAAMDASLYSYLNRDYCRVLMGRGYNLKVSTSGLNIIIDTGEAIILGRHVRLTEATTIPVNGNSNGQLVIEIDLNKSNSSTGIPGNSDYTTINNQLDIKAVTGTLIQQDLNDFGKIYQFSLGSFTSTATGVTFLQNNVVYSSSSIAIKDVTGLESELSILKSRLAALEAK